MSGEGPFFVTFSGNRYHFLDPDPKEVTILDIAHALSLQCRYAGHSPRFYSVAEHSVLVSRAVPTEHALVGLLHDAAEAYVGDLIRPCKMTLRAMKGAEVRAPGRYAPTDFDQLEANAQAAVIHRFDLPAEVPDIVRVVDQMVGQRECVDMGRPRYGEGWSDSEEVEPADVEMLYLPPFEAEELFLARWLGLTERTLETGTGT